MTDAPNMTPEESYNQALGIGTEPDASGQETVQPVDQAVTPDAEAPKGTNPSWDEAWKDVPAALRDNLMESQKPVFEKWDRDYQELQARHRPFQEYEQNGISPTQLEQAIQIQQLLFENPREFYDRIGQAWGFHEQQQDVAARAAAGAAIDPNEYDDPTVKALAEQVAQQQAVIESWNQQQTVQQQQYQEQEQTRQNVQWTANQMANLEGRVGALTEEDKVAVVERAILNANLGRNASVEVAYFDLKREEDRIAAQLQQRAPRVLGGGGAQVSNQPPAVDYSKETPEERIARAMQVAKAASESFSNAPQ